MKKQNQKNHDAGASLHWLIGLNTLLPSCVNKVKVKVTQLCLTLCNPMDCNHGILQDRILEWVAFPFSRVSSQPRDQNQVSLITGGFFTYLCSIR